jgi:phosphoribosyl 1,2-cyclic phosphodiesterase
LKVGNLSQKDFHLSKTFLFLNRKILSFAGMSLFITSLNSGSNGNCYYVGNETEAVLVDAGISCREIEKRMKRLGLLMEKVKAVFISHEHSDHIKGLPSLVKKYRLPVYITEATRRHGRLEFEINLINLFNAHEAVNIGNLSVTAFPKFHDASDPYSFVISCNKICVGVFTDIGKPCKNVIQYFKQCHAAFLEANYDEEMLQNGNYPFHLKKRISGGLGHLSNKEALELFIMHKPHFMSHLLLAHLSQNNNSPELVQEIFNAHAGNVQITVASRFQETEVFHICSKQFPQVVPELKRHKKPVPTQLSFGFI